MSPMLKPDTPPSAKLELVDAGCWSWQFQYPAGTAAKSMALFHPPVVPEASAAGRDAVGTVGYPPSDLAQIVTAPSLRQVSAWASIWALNVACAVWL